MYINDESRVFIRGGEDIEAGPRCHTQRGLEGMGPLRMLLLTERFPQTL